MLKFFALAFAAALLSCQSEIVGTIYTPNGDHEAYALALKQAGLDQSYLGKAWMNAANEAFDQPIRLDSPTEEAFYFSDREASARSYQFDVRRGEEISITITRLNEHIPDTTALPLFVDLFRLDSFAVGGRILVASFDKASGTLEFEPRQDEIYLLRIQHELLAGGRYALRLEKGPRLSFPVQGGKNYDIGSFFGDPRDGGRRLHHGVDIFAKRHTPILAPCEGHIRFAGEKGLGGKVVWMRNQAKKLTLYFAHLHTIIAEEGTYVKTGDTLGTVGNTGNAITTPPHLHFGIYSKGPIDPYPFIAYQNARLKPLLKNLELLGGMQRTKKKCRFWMASGEKSYLPSNQWIKAIGLNDKFIHVKLADGSYGKILLHDLETLQDPLRQIKVPDQFALRESIHQESTTINHYSSSANHQILALADEHMFVRAADGHLGWTSRPL